MTPDRSPAADAHRHGRESRTGPLRLVCDEMLKGLARWLRAAGHDACVGPDGASDRSLLARAIAESRWLITRDAGLTRLRQAGDVVLVLGENGLDRCARELTGRLDVDWLYAPFTRCLRCNSMLQQGPPPLASCAVSPPPRRDLRHCPNCKRVYWEGSHVRRMRRQLSAWQGARPRAAGGRHPPGSGEAG